VKPVTGSKRALLAAGAGLAVVASLPLVVAHVAGAAGEQSGGLRTALVVSAAEGATAWRADGSARAGVPWLLPGDGDVAVSRSGRRIAFTSSRDGNPELYVVDTVTGKVTRITWSLRSEDIDPTWSPDGGTIVWASGKEESHDLYRIRFDRTRMRRLTRGPADDVEPAWSPDGRRIAFSSNRNGAYDLWSVAPDGAAPEILLDAAGDARAPSWHPTGTRLAYTGIVGGAADVWVTDASGLQARRLVASRGYDGRPGWSPDGRLLAFLRGDGGSLRPWIARVGGKDPRPVEGSPRGADHVSWALLGPGLAPSRASRLPDLDQRPPADLVVRVGVRGRFLLGFTSATDNVGDGPLWLRGHRSTTSAPMLVDQLVESRGGGATAVRGVGRLRYELHPPHRHWHLDDFVRYELRRLDGSLVVRDRKSGFCLIDRWGNSRRLPGKQRALPRFLGDCATLRPDALRVEEGSSVGYTDRYPAFFHGQDLDLTGLPAGLYRLVQRANPERLLRELDYGNNSASTLLRLTWPGGQDLPPRIGILRTCARGETCAK
jgi:TolB protein